MQPSEEIKQKIDIVDFIRDYIELIPAGVNFKAKCPFHKENTPSFIVSPDKQIWHCFGCGKGGDVFAFLMEMENIDFVEALKVLAPKAGVVLKKQDPRKISERNRLLEALDLSRRFYHKVLMDSPAAKAAWNYLIGRGLSEDTIEEWQIGYAPDTWDSLINFLRGRGYNNQEIRNAGLSAQSSMGKGDYDRFRGRIMFPIFDVNGNTVAFSARISPDKEEQEKTGKYINSPQNKIYDKSRILFGLDKAKRAIRQERAAVLAEGQMDVITAHQNGFKNTIASSGTALTSEQVDLVKRYAPSLLLAFDRDEAGLNAAERAMIVASQGGLNVKVIEVPQGKDPDDCIKEDPEMWREAVAKARPMLAFYIDNSLRGLDMENIDDKREAVKRIMPKIYLLKNRIDQDYWLAKLSNKTGINEESLRDVLKGIKPPGRMYKQKAPESAPIRKVASREEAQSELLIALLCKFPYLADYLIRHLELSYLKGENNIAIYKNMILYYNNIVNDTSVDSAKLLAENVLFTENNQFRQWLENFLHSQNSPDVAGRLSHFDKLAILSEKEYYDLEVGKAKIELVKLIKELKLAFLLKRRREITGLIAQANERPESESGVEAMMKELKDLNEEIRELGQ